MQDVTNMENTTTDIQIQDNDITTKAVLLNGYGRVDNTNGSTSLYLIVSKRGVRTLLRNNNFAPSARLMTRDIVVLEDVTEPEFFEGMVEASGTGVPTEEYAFYRFDNSNVVDGLNSRVEIEMQKNTSKGYIFGRDLTIGTDTQSDSQ
jgi:hypothetical protein